MREKLPLFSQAMLADAMFVGGGDRAHAKQLLTELLNHAKESPAEVHFEETDALSYATEWSSDPRTTAIVLQTLTDVSPDHPYVGKIGRYLTKVRKGNGQFRNTQEAAFALMALAEVVRTKEKDAPSFAARVELGDELLSSLPFRGRDMGVRSVSVPTEKLTKLSGTTRLTFSKSGPGVLYYGALFRYAPAVVPQTPLDRGIVVQRWFEPYEGGGRATTFYAGDLVRIRVRIGTPMERQYVAVDVPLPAGLEAVDTSLATTAAQPRKKNEEGPTPSEENESAEDQGQERPSNGEQQGEAEDAWGWNPTPFNHVEQRDDRVVLFADHLPPGVHTASFVARATTAGRFVMKSAYAEEMYTPEVFGRSEAGEFQVIETGTDAR